VRHLVSSGSSLVGEHHLCGGVNRHLLDVPAIGGLPRLLEQDYERKRKTKDGILRDAPMPTHTIQRVAPPDVGWLTCNLFNYHFLFSGSACMEEMLACGALLRAVVGDASTSSCIAGLCPVGVESTPMKGANRREIDCWIAGSRVRSSCLVSPPTAARTALRHDYFLRLTSSGISNDCKAAH
jgi:hypothetical protein